MYTNSDNNTLRNKIKYFIRASYILIFSLISFSQIVAQVTASYNITPPYNIPIDDMRDQMMLTVNSTVAGAVLTGYFTWEIRKTDNSIVIGTKDRISEGKTLELGSNTFTGSDFNTIFNLSNIDFTGINGNDAFYGQGLTPGTYRMTFYIYSRSIPSSATLLTNTSATFTVQDPTITVTTTISPPYNIPFEDLADRTQVTINSNVMVDDGFLTMSLEGDNGIQISTVAGFVPDYLVIDAGIPFVVSGSDMLVYFTTDLLLVNGIALNDLEANGLPHGNYELCFQLWYDEGEPASEGPPAGCTSFEVPLPSVSLNVSMTPPYDIPLFELPDQTTLTINSSGPLSQHHLTVDISGDNGVSLSTLPSAIQNLPLESGTPMVLTGPDLSEFFNTSSLQIRGVEESTLNISGLPPGTYDVCFTSWYDGSSTLAGPACQTITIEEAMTSITTTVQPPYENPLPDWADQTTVMINTSRDQDNAYLKMNIQGNNGVNIQTKNNVVIPIDLMANVPATFTGSDLEDHFNSGNLNFTGLTANEANTIGLPPGSYDICFQLFNAENRPLTDAAMGCASFTIDLPMATLSTIFTAPYNIPLTDWADQTTVNIQSNRALQDALLSFSMTGDNGITINSRTGMYMPVDIDANTPTMLSGSDLSASLDIAALNISGISSTELMDNGLPDGSYEYCFRLWYDNDTPLTGASPEGCTNFVISPVTITINTIVQPPYELPLDELADQTMVTLLSSGNISDVHLTMKLMDAGGEVIAQSNANVNTETFDLVANDNTSVDPVIISNLFNRANLIFGNISPDVLYSDGLPEGSYQLCMQLWYPTGLPATGEDQGCANINVSGAMVSLSTMVNPPYDVPLEELLQQTIVTVNSNRDFSSTSLIMQISGGNGIMITSNFQSIVDNIDLVGNEQLMITPSDYISISANSLVFQGINADEAINNGLPEGNYDICFQLFDRSQQPLTEEPPIGCFTFSIVPTSLVMTATVIPPYSHLMDQIPEITQVNIISSSNQEIILRASIEGDNDIVINNPESFIPTEVISLEANVPQLVTGIDLGEYFAMPSLTATGIGITDLFDSGLPQGGYQVCFEAFTPEGEALDVPKACSNLMLIEAIEPPQIILPECGSTLPTNSNRPIVFSWLPPIGADIETQYVLRIVEIMDTGRDPNEAMLAGTTPSFFEEIITGTSYNYGPADPLFDPGKTYAFQVSIYQETINRNLLNRGRSVVCYFTIEDEEEEVVFQEEDETGISIIKINKGIKNPFPGYFFPVSQVSGTLNYTFELGLRTGQVKFVMGGVEQGNNPYQAVFNQNAVQIPTPVYNESVWTAPESYPVENVKLSLLKTYVFYGSMNGESVNGKVIRSGNVQQNKEGFAMAAPGWNEIVATTTTDGDGNFQFNVVNFDSLSTEPISLDFHSTNGDIYSSHVHITGSAYPVYRLIVESPYYCSPEMNIFVQPWESIDVGDLYSRVNSYDLEVLVERDTSGFDFDYNSANVLKLTNVATSILRKSELQHIPDKEGQPEKPPLPDQAIAKILTDADGIAKFTDLVRHDANNPIDHYYVHVVTNEFVGAYNYKENESPYPIFPYSSDWDWKNKNIGMTFGMPTSVNAGQEFYFKYNSEFEKEVFQTRIAMQPELPRAIGHVYSKQAETGPLAKPERVNELENNYTIQGNTVGNFLSSNGSSQNMASSALFAQVMFSEAPNWSELLNMTPISGSKLKMMSFAKQNHQLFTGWRYEYTNEDGFYQFNGLQIEIDWSPESMQTFGAQIIGPSRILFADEPGYKHEAIDIGVLKWGDQFIHNFELEPDGYIYGWVTDEYGQPVKADVYVDDLVSVTTVMSQEYQDILGIPGALKEVFVLKAPSGGGRTLKVVPDDPGYGPAEYSIDIEENTDPYQPQNLGAFEVFKYKHRIKLRVMENLGNAIINKIPVKNALVKVTNILGETPETNTKMSGSAPEGGGFENIIAAKANVNLPNIIQAQPAQVLHFQETDILYGYTDEDGYVQLSFENNGSSFDIEVIPPMDKDLVSKSLTITSEASFEFKDKGEILLDQGFRIHGIVTYGPDSTRLAGARVFIDMGGDNIETFTGGSGAFTLKGIPLDQNQWEINAENLNADLTLIADHQTITAPFPMQVNFHLDSFDDFALNNLWGLPITISSIEEDNGNVVIDGAFVNLPANANFTIKDEDHRLEFIDVTVQPEEVNGELIGVPVSSEILVDLNELEMINYTELIAEIRPSSGAQLKIIPENQNQGVLAGKVNIMSSSFQFDDNYVDFNEGVQQESNSSTSTGGQIIQSSTIQQMVYTSAIGKSYINLFSNNNSFYLLNPATDQLNVNTITADDYPMQAFNVADQYNSDYEFEIQDFHAFAVKDGSYVYNDSLHFNIELRTNAIPKMVPEVLVIEAGEIVITKDGFSKVISDKHLSIKLEEWEIEVENWTLDQHSTGIKLDKATLKTNLFTTPMKDFKITPDDFIAGSLDLNKFEFGGIVPVTIESPYLAFGIEEHCTSDNGAHWKISVAGIDGKEGASIANLPGMESGDKIKFESISIFSNGEKNINMGDQVQTLPFYDILDVTPDMFVVVEGGLEMFGKMDLNIPRLQQSRGGFRYKKVNGQVVSEFLGMEIDFEGPGRVRFIAVDEPNSQVLTQGIFDGKVKIRDVEGIKLLGRLHKDLDSTYVIVEPLHQKMNIAEDGSNKLVEITGDMHVEGSDWGFFVFSGDLEGMKGVEDSKKRKTFIVEGSINAEGEGMDVKNISADFGGMKITYDIQHARLTGELVFSQDFSSLSIEGKANFLTDRDGWYFIASGSITAPGFGNLQAGIGIGDYDDMRPEIQDQLLYAAYNKTLPDGFKNGFSGFFITGRKNIPQLTIPKQEFNFLIISGSLEGQVGLDARIWMSFDESATEFGIGVMAFAYIEFALSAITCTDLYGYIGAELGITGVYNSGTGNFSLTGCGSLTLMGAFSQCTPNPITFSCTDPCLSDCGSISLKMEMYIDSGGTVDATMGLGSCGGGPSLEEKVGDKFNCN